MKPLFTQMAEDLFTVLARPVGDLVDTASSAGIRSEVRDRLDRLVKEHHCQVAEMREAHNREIGDLIRLRAAAEANRLQDRRRLMRSWMANGECAWMIARAWEELGDEKMAPIFEACPRLTQEKDLVDS